MKRKFLTDLGITDNEVIDKIINTHQATVTDMKDELTKTKTDYEAKIETLSKDDITPKLKELQSKYKELEDKYTADIEAKTLALTEFETKYKTDVEAKEKELADFKTNVETKELKQNKTNLLRQSLEKDGANPKLLDLLMKAIDIDTLEIDAKTNSLKNYADITKPVKEQFKDVFSTTTIVTNADTPIVNTGTPNVAEPKSLSEALHSKYKTE